MIVLKSINTSQDIFYDFKTQLSLTSFLNNIFFFYPALWNYIFARTILNVNEYSNTLTQDMHNSKDPRLNKTLSFETHYRPKVTNFTYLIFWDFLFFFKRFLIFFKRVCDSWVVWLETEFAQRIWKIIKIHEKYATNKHFIFIGDSVIIS